MESHQIVVAQPVEETVIHKLGDHGTVFMNAGPDPLSAGELKDSCRDALALMAFMTECVDESLLRACPRLKIVAGALKGYDNIDIEACSRRNIVVTVVPDLLTEPTAELAIGLMIGVARHVIPADRYVRSGQFAGWRPRFFGGSLQGATIGVVGAGRVGQSILRLLLGFRCDRLYYDRASLSAELEGDLKANAVSLDDLRKRSDFVVLALPLTDDTLGIVDADFIAAMKPGSYLVNPARGSLVSEQAVVDALECGHLAGFAADVFESEDWARQDRPSDVHLKLRQSDRTMLTPHIGSAVRDVRSAIVRSAANSIMTVLTGAMPETAVNADIVGRS